MLRFLIISLLLSICLPALSQEGDRIVTFGKVVNGDTIPVIPLKEVNVYAWKVLSKREERKLTRLMKNVKIVYPYARLAGLMLPEYEILLASTDDDKERRQIMRRLEDELQDQYGQELRDLTISQGKILLKLLDRETGESSYELVSEFRGEFRAVFYQAFARIFGLNMKLRYDPEGEDRDIEYIVRMIENGQL